MSLFDESCRGFDIIGQSEQESVDPDTAKKKVHKTKGRRDPRVPLPPPTDWWVIADCDACGKRFAGREVTEEIARATYLLGTAVLVAPSTYQCPTCIGMPSAGKGQGKLHRRWDDLAEKQDRIGKDVLGSATPGVWED